MAESVTNPSPPPPPASFTLKISEKLTEKHYLILRQQVEPYVIANGLHGFLVYQEIPPQYLTESDHLNVTVNPAYQAWMKKDQMLQSWLQSSLLSEMLSRILGIVHAYEVWEHLHAYFQKQTRAQARQLRSELRAALLNDRTVQKYLLRIKVLVDLLVSIGDLVPINQHLAMILEGLPQDYTSVVSVVESKFESMDIEEVEALLLAHELCLEKFKKKAVTGSISVNIRSN